MRKLLVPIAIVLVLVFIISGCSNSSTSPTATVPITTVPTAAAPTTTAATTSNTPTVTTSPVSPSPVVATSPTATSNKYTSGSLIRYILRSAPTTPIGYPAETAGGSVTSIQLCAEIPMNEMLGGRFNPGIVTSIDVDSGSASPSLTFHIRKGVKFQDGTDFNAQALKWNLENLKSAAMYAGSTIYYKSIEAVDDYTCRINFTEWRNILIRGITGDSMGFMVSPTAFQKNGIEWMRWHMVGTGAYTQTDFQRDVSLTAVRNPNYWDTGKPYVDKFQLIYVTDMMTAQALFKSGGAEMMASDLRTASQLQSEGYNISVQHTGATVLIPDSKNTSSPWANQKVRLAAEYAIDKVQMTKTFGYGYTNPAYQLVSSIISGYDDKLPPRTYDTAKAKQLLADAGYPNGFKSKIIAQNNADQNILVALQSYLTKIGISIELEIVDAGKFQSYATGTWNNGLLFTGLLEHYNYNDDLNFYFGEPSSFYQSLKHPDGWMPMFTESMKTPIKDASLPAGDPIMITKLLDAIYDDCMIIPLYYGATVNALQNNVHDTGLGTLQNSWHFTPQNAWLSK